MINLCANIQMVETANAHTRWEVYANLGTANTVKRPMNKKKGGMKPMQEMILNEVWKSSSIGENYAKNETLLFFSKLMKSKKIEIIEVEYGDRKAYSGYKVLEIECKVKDTISFNDGNMMFHNDDRVLLIVTCYDDNMYDCEVGDTYVEEIIGNYDFIPNDWIDFSKGYDI